jgi:hypothetical protein
MLVDTPIKSPAPDRPAVRQPTSRMQANNAEGDVRSARGTL